MLTFSKYDENLPQALQEMNWLHQRVRSGAFGKLNLADAEAAYIQALMDSPDSQLSQEIKELMENGVAVNRILEYVTDEFTGYEMQMEAKCQKHVWVYPNFTDEAERKKITERLQREDLDSVELLFTHHGEPETYDLTGLSKMKLSQRFEQFWEVVSEMTKHNESRNCNMKIEEIRFVF